MLRCRIAPWAGGGPWRHCAPPMPARPARPARTRCKCRTGGSRDRPPPAEHDSPRLLAHTGPAMNRLVRSLSNRQTARHGCAQNKMSQDASSTRCRQFPQCQAPNPASPGPARFPNHPAEPYIPQRPARPPLARRFSPTRLICRPSLQGAADTSARRQINACRSQHERLK